MTTKSRGIWTPAMVTAVGGVVASLLLSFSTLIVSCDAKKNSATIKEDTAHILVVTNSNLAALTKKLEVSETRIDGLERVNATLTEAKKDAVQALSNVTDSKSTANPQPK